jgi:hypothetical protein
MQTEQEKEVWESGDSLSPVIASRAQQLESPMGQGVFNLKEDSEESQSKLSPVGLKNEKQTGSKARISATTATSTVKKASKISKGNVPNTKSEQTNAQRAPNLLPQPQQGESPQKSKVEDVKRSLLGKANNYQNGNVAQEMSPPQQKSSILNEVLSQTSPKPTRPSPEKRSKVQNAQRLHNSALRTEPAESVSESTQYDWIYKDRPAAKEEIAAILSSESQAVTVDILLDVISKLKIDLDRLAPKETKDINSLTVKQTEEDSVRYELQSLNREIEQYLSIAETDRNEILSNTKLLDEQKRKAKGAKDKKRSSKSPNPFTNNRLNKSAGNIELSHLTEDSVFTTDSPQKVIRPKSPQAKIADAKTLNATLTQKRLELQEELDSKLKPDLELHGGEFKALKETLNKISSDTTVKLFSDNMEALLNQIATKKEGLDFVEGNMMRERHFILNQLGDKKEALLKAETEFQSLLDAGITRVEREKKKALQLKEEQKRQTALMYDDPYLQPNQNQFNFQSPAVAEVKQFDEDMSQFGRSTNSSATYTSTKLGDNLMKSNPDVLNKVLSAEKPAKGSSPKPNLKQDDKFRSSGGAKELPKAKTGSGKPAIKVDNSSVSATPPANWRRTAKVSMFNDTGLSRTSDRKFSSPQPVRK